MLRSRRLTLRSCEKAIFQRFWSSGRTTGASRHLRNASTSGPPSGGDPNQTGRKVIFSGIQPTGVPHLGNYLGALRQWVQLQNKAAETDELYFSIVDLHAITTQPDASLLRRWRRETLAALLAIGLKPDRCHLFYQSAVPEHTELMWILSCSASMGYLSRMTQWKSKTGVSEGLSETALANARSKLKLGLFSYPVLQAADVLLYDTTHVPVGEDQSQHLEFARETAESFNAAHGETFVLPETILSPTKRIMSLKEPTLKMSKSHVDAKSRILLSDAPESIDKKLRGAVTDSINGVTFEPETRPGVSNLIGLAASLNQEGKLTDELVKDYADMSLADLKHRVSQIVRDALGEVRQRYEELIREGNHAELDEIANQGAQKAHTKAQKTMRRVRSAIGL